MSVDQTNKIDFLSLDTASGNVLLSISDHLPWDEGEGNHLVLLQDKLNTYLRFVESGEMFEKYPEAKGRNVVINLVSKFALSRQAENFFMMAKKAIEDAGFQLQFTLIRAN